MQDKWRNLNMEARDKSLVRGVDDDPDFQACGVLCWVCSEHHIKTLEAAYFNHVYCRRRIKDVGGVGEVAFIHVACHLR